MTDERAEARPDDQRWVYWCKQRDGRIIEHVTDAYSGHKGHVRCVPIAAVEGSR